MRVGEKYGLGDIYNEDGSLILKEGEEILLTDDNIICRAFKWKIYDSWKITFNRNLG